MPHASVFIQQWDAPPGAPAGQPRWRSTAWKPLKPQTAGSGHRGCPASSRRGIRACKHQGGKKGRNPGLPPSQATASHKIIWCPISQGWLAGQRKHASLSVMRHMKGGQRLAEGKAALLTFARCLCVAMDKHRVTFGQALLSLCKRFRPPAHLALCPTTLIALAHPWAQFVTNKPCPEAESTHQPSRAHQLDPPCPPCPVPPICLCCT